MNDVEKISYLNHRSFSGKAWHGKAVEQIVSDVTAEQAAAPPALGDHTIRQIVLHMIVWKDNVTGAIEGGVFEVINAERDWPTVGDTTEAAWQKTLQELRDCEIRLQQALGRFEEAKLEETVPGRTYTFYFMLHCLPNHDTYHAAQIALLKKAPAPGA